MHPAIKYVKSIKYHYNTAELVKHHVQCDNNTAERRRSIQSQVGTFVFALNLHKS